jgi:hypothetical protein
MRCALLVVVTVLGVASVSASAQPIARASRTCAVPRLTTLTLTVARERAARAGCTLRVKGAELERATVQTVERQSPVRGRRASGVTVWLNPFCHGSAAYGPELAEPTVTPGPTELVGGFYLVGGPLARFSDPGCKRPAPPPGAGSVDVMNASGTIVATQTSNRGHFVVIPLPAGSYTITGTFGDATINGMHPKKTVSLVIPPGHTVRQDFFLSVP